MERLEDRLLLATWSGDLADGTVWTNDEVQRIVGDVRVPPGATLTIEPGTLVKVNTWTGLHLTVEGRLLAPGTTDQPILLTSWSDDTGPDAVLGTADDLDSNSDGPSTGSKGEWGGISFESSSTGSVLEHVDVRYTGGLGRPTILVDGGELTLRDSALRESWKYGVRIQTSQPALSGVTFINHDLAAMSMDLYSNPAIAGVTFVNNAINGLAVDAGELPSDSVWDDPDVVYSLSGEVTIPVGRTLTVAAGQVVKPYIWGPGLTVAGRLLVNGTAARPVVFTSYRDDSAGGDTNNDGQSVGSSSDWTEIMIAVTSTGSVISHADIRYGQGSSNAQIFVDGGELTLRDSVIQNGRANGLEARNRDVTISGSTFRDNGLSGAVLVNCDATLMNNTFDGNGTIGLRLEGGNPIVMDSTFRDNISAAASMDLASNPRIEGVSFLNNGVNGLLIDSGTFPGNAAWNNPDIVYVLNSGWNAYTVPAGTVLTIGAGQIVKSGVQGLSVSGRLLVTGTAERPVVFTSLLDDTAGGDTNNDGPVNRDRRSEWPGLEFAFATERSVIDYAEIRYGGIENGNDGSILVNTSDLHVRNTVIRNGYRSAITTVGQAVLRLENSLLFDNVRGDLGLSRGIRAVEGQVTAINNTIDGNDRGIEIGDASVTLINNLITFNGHFGISLGQNATLDARFNNMFNPTAQSGNYQGIADQTGLNGNRSVDPQYYNRGNFQYQLRAGSPVIDAATSDFAPSNDIRGNERFDVPNVPNQGGGIRPFYDMGALESQEIGRSDIDLATIAVSGPTTGTPDDMVTVQWTVKNLGAGTALGHWSDAVYLSPDPVWDIADRLLGRLEHEGGLGPGQQYDATLDVRLKVERPGPHYFVVRTNDRGDVFEALAVANNGGVSAAPIDFAVPSLILGVPFADQFTAAGQSKYYELVVPAGETLALTLDSAVTSGVTELYVRRNRLPTRVEFDFRGADDLRPDRTLAIPTTGPGVYYILAYADSGPASTSDFTITARVADFGIRSFFPRYATGGPATIRIEGTALTPDVQVDLVGNSFYPGPIPADSIQFGDATQVFATFNSPPSHWGTQHQIRLTQQGETRTSSENFCFGFACNNLFVSFPGRLHLEVVAPDRVRFGQMVNFTINYENAGEADITAPLLVVEARNALIQHPEQPGIQSPTYQFLATNFQGPAGVLPSKGLPHTRPSRTPLPTNAIQLRLIPLNEGEVSIDVWQAAPDPRIDWAAKKEQLRPSNVSIGAWEVIYANFLASVAPVVSDVREYEAALARNATYLSRLGEYTQDLGRLLALELARAGDYGEIAQRYRTGAMGRGVPDPTDVRAVEDADFNVEIQAGGRSRPFYRTLKGTYQGMSGDPGILIRVGNAFRLREADGTITMFRDDGQLDFVEDMNGNRVLMEYDNDRMIGFVDSFADRVTYAYNDQGRIIQITDAVGQVTSLEYDLAGDHLLSITDPRGTIRFAYISGQGAAREHAVASITLPDNTHQFFEYDDRGRLSRTFRDGGALEVGYSYDADGGVTITDAAGDRRTVYVNEYGKPAILKDAMGRMTRLTYDGNRNLVRVVGPDGSDITTTYDKSGHPVSVEDAIGQRVDFAYEPSMNRLLSLRDPLGRTTLFGYDARGNPTGVVHPDGRRDSNHPTNSRRKRTFPAKAAQNPAHSAHKSPPKPPTCKPWWTHGLACRKA